jgi:predicted DNA-binding transcriptional regulator AlpA
MNIQPALMDLRQTADFLQTSESSIRRRTAEGSLPGSRKIGSQVRWARSVLELWIVAGCPVDAMTFELELRQRVHHEWSGIVSGVQTQKPDGHHLDG